MPDRKGCKEAHHKDKRFSQLPVREQAEYLIEALNLVEAHPDLSEDELVAEVIEFIICPVLQEQARKNRNG